ncbi:hypothetical protein QE390_002973 [Siphonobacter sp. SORGH_AS 1065]|nr:hypothetical protein [Siphonobacter sp. SORGH_AS_1065]
MDKVITYDFTDLRKEINDSIVEHNKYGVWEGLSITVQLF